MIKHAFSFNLIRRASAVAPTAPLTRRARLLWTLGNSLMLFGVVALLYAGGLYSLDVYGAYAARGDTDAPAPIAVTLPDAQAEPPPFTAPLLNTQAAQANDDLAAHTRQPVAAADHQSTVTRIAIPSIEVDSKVIEVGWDIVEENGQQTAIWQVAKYAVGQHHGSANPGEGGNVVLAGHVGGYGKVFKDLYYVQPGDPITLYSNGEQYLYTVRERLLVTEEGVSAEQRAANAKLIEPTAEELVTLVTCWPPTGEDKFTQRVVVQAVPFSSAAQSQQSQWSIR